MRPVMVRLREYERMASVSEKEIVQYMLQRPDEVIKMSVHDLARETFTSASTVIRLARKVGFKGFKELKKDLIVETTLRQNHTIPEQKEIRKEDSTREIMDKIAYKHMISIDETKSLMDIEVFDKCVEVMLEAQEIHLFGIGASYLAVKDMQQKLMRIGRLCVGFEDQHLQILQARNMKAGQVALMFSYSGQTKELIRCAEHIKEGGATLISVTRFGQSIIADLADYNLYIASNEPLHRSGAMTSRSAQLYVVDMLYTRYIHETYENAYKVISKTQLDKMN
ncbi:MAG: MurR/RpiR family transcriptional regulator [Cellulosilyticaceae bacterium]